MDEVAEEETRLFCKSIHLRRHPVEVRRPSPLSRPPHEHASSEVRRETRRLSLRRLFFSLAQLLARVPRTGIFSSLGRTEVSHDLRKGKRREEEGAK